MKKIFSVLIALCLLMAGASFTAMAEEQWTEFPEMGIKLLLTEENVDAGFSTIAQDGYIALLFTDSSGICAPLAEVYVYPEETFTEMKSSSDYPAFVISNHITELGTHEGNGYLLVSAFDFPNTDDFLTIVLGTGVLAELGDRKAEWEGAIAALPSITETVDFIPVIKAEKTVPAFTTVDIYGNTFTNEIFAQADLTVVNIWGTFCGPCINEMPELGQWSREMPENVQIIGLVSDIYSADDTATIGNAQAIVEATGADFVNLLPAEGLTELLTISPYVPTTVFVDSNGKLVGEPVIGANVAEYKRFVEEYLNGLE